MKSKQLANVLIKIIGLYVCVCAIPGVISGIAALFIPDAGVPKFNEAFVRLISWGIGDAVQALFGIILISKSRKLAGFWFKNEEE
ncbi:MAG: hypothetical protein ABSF51_11135 [Verrucomicrobiota bacterium]|jgi:hypothetical protein